MTRALPALIACSILTGVTTAQVPDEDDGRIRIRTGPPLTEGTQEEWRILSTGAGWLRVNPIGTTADVIVWEFFPRPEHAAWSFSWNRHSQSSGQSLPRETNIPITDRRLYPGNMPLYLWERLKPEPFIGILASTRPVKASASFCVFYQQRGVALVRFTGTVERVIDVAGRAPECVPPPESVAVVTEDQQ
jgi:hypothetical protein